jgi:hypothetical protein
MYSTRDLSMGIIFVPYDWSQWLSGRDFASRSGNCEFEFLSEHGRDKPKTLFRIVVMFCLDGGHLEARITSLLDMTVENGGLFQWRI